MSKIINYIEGIKAKGDPSKMLSGTLESSYRLSSTMKLMVPFEYQKTSKQLFDPINRKFVLGSEVKGKEWIFDENGAVKGKTFKDYQEVTPQMHDLARKGMLQNADNLETLTSKEFSGGKEVLQAIYEQNEADEIDNSNSENG